MFGLKRTNRATYWLMAACVVGFSVVLGLVSPGSVSFGEVVWVFVCAPRLHDIGRSAWWVAAPIALEIVVGLGAGVFLRPDAAGIVFVVLTLVILGLIAWLGSVRGDAGANRFGEPPPPGIDFNGKAAARLARSSSPVKAPGAAEDRSEEKAGEEAGPG